MSLASWWWPSALGAGGVALVAWNLAVGSQRTAPSIAGRTLRLLTALAAFLLLPAFAVAALAPTATGARVLDPLAWLWPVVSLLAVLQTMSAMARGTGSTAVALALLPYNSAVAWMATAQWIDRMGGSLPGWAMLPGTSAAVLASAMVGPAGFTWGAALLLPALAPLAPARGRAARAGRAALAAACLAVIGALAFTVPRARGLMDAATRPIAGEPGSRGASAIGLSLFGPLNGPPSSAIARLDLGLADSLGIGVAQVTLRTSGTDAAALDSLARTLEGHRDSLTLIVALPLDDSPEALVDVARRVQLARVERVVRRLRPHVLVPGCGGSATVARDATAWQDLLEEIVAAAARGDRRTRVAAPTWGLAGGDSAVADGVIHGTSRVRALALCAASEPDPASFNAAREALARWMSLAPEAAALPDVWIAGVPTAPTVTGVRVQQQMVRHALQWASRHPWVRGIIVGEASDVTAPTALRTASGRARPALDDVAQALRTQREATPPPLPAADSAAAPDSSVITTPAAAPLPPSQP